MEKMNKYLNYICIILTILAINTLIMPYHVMANTTLPCPVFRLSGLDRYQTAVSISRTGWSSSEYVVVSTGEGNDKFADALSGSPLSFILNAPILLTNTSILNIYAIDEVARLRSKKVILLGGTGAISANVENHLKSMGLSVERLWGSDRYSTAIKIGERIRSIKSFSKVVLTTGDEFQYAMMISPCASKNGTPILFSEKYILTPATSDAIRSWNIKEVDIIGNTNVISQAVEDTLLKMGVKINRIGGADIIETNINIANTYGTGTGYFAVARDDVFADGLAGAPLAAKLNIPILLTGQNYINPKLSDYINKYKTEGAYIFGGIFAVSDTVIQVIRKGLQNLSVYGNTPGNIANGAIAAIDGEWIYYLNDSDGKKLYKIKTDGSGKIKLSNDMPLGINTVGDWIYYENLSDESRIYKIKKDGSCRTRLNDEESWNLNVVDNWAYYTVNTDIAKISRMGIDGSNSTVISTDMADCVNVVGDWVYYLNWDEGRIIYKVKTDGTERTKVNDEGAWGINVIGDWIYYSNDGDNNTLYKIKTDGTNKTKINNDITHELNVVGDFIYYSNASDDNKLYKIKTDASERSLVHNGPTYILNIVGYWVYFTSDLEGLLLFKVKTDGSNLTKIN